MHDHGIQHREGCHRDDEGNRGHDPGPLDPPEQETIENQAIYQADKSCRPALFDPSQRRQERDRGDESQRPPSEWWKRRPQEESAK